MKITILRDPKLMVTLSQTFQMRVTHPKQNPTRSQKTQIFQKKVPPVSPVPAVMTLKSHFKALRDQIMMMVKTPQTPNDSASSSLKHLSHRATGFNKHVTTITIALIASDQPTDPA